MKNEEILCKKQQKEEKDNSDFQRLIRVCRKIFFLLTFEGFLWTFYGYFAVTLRDFGKDFTCGRRFPYFVHENLSNFDKN